MSTDKFQFAKSNATQSIDDIEPFVSEAFNYVNDIYSGVYSGNGSTLINFDLSSVYNSSRCVDLSRSYVTIPVVYCAAYTAPATNTPLALAANISYFQQVALKFNGTQLIHQIELSINGKTIEQIMPYSNVWNTLRLVSQMSQDELNQYGMTTGLGSKIDNSESLRYNSSTLTGNAPFTAFANNAAYPSLTTGTFLSAAGVAGGSGGNGLSNNVIYGVNSNDGDQTAPGNQNSSTYNIGAYYRTNRICDYTAPAGTIATGVQSGLYGTNGIQTLNNANTEFKPSFQVIGNVGVWTDYVVIPVAWVLDSVKQWPLCKKVDAMLRIYVNANAMVNAQCCINNAGSNSGCGLISSGNYNTFPNTCPLMLMSVCNSTGLLIPASGGAATVPTNITAGLYIGKVQSISLNGVNFTTMAGVSIPNNPMNACRFYYPLVELKPNLRELYFSENRNKNIVYTTFLYNQFNSITAGSSFSQLVQSGLTNLRGVWILPVPSSTVNGLISATGTGLTSFSVFQSPFTDGVNITGPISLINVNATVAGVNIVQNALVTTYENFIQQTSRYEKSASPSDLGLSQGLLSQYMWENGCRAYYIDLSRGTLADQMNPRNLNINFSNNSNITIDVLTFTEVYKEIVVDTETGLIK